VRRHLWFVCYDNSNTAKKVKSALISLVTIVKNVNIMKYIKVCDSFPRITIAVLYEQINYHYYDQQYHNYYNYLIFVTY